MLLAALKLQGLITSFSASQQLDSSMKGIKLTEVDWVTLSNLERLFSIFVKPTEKCKVAATLR